MKTNIRLKTDFISKLFLLTVLLALFQMSLSAQQKSLSAQQWKELHTGVTEDLYDVCCIDTSTVFACGQNGVILKTTDGGENWEEKYRRPGCQTTTMCFATPLIGYAFCDSVLSGNSHTWSLLKTEDGGETWHQTGAPYISEFNISQYLVLSNRYVRSEITLNGTDTILVAVSFDGVYRSLNGGGTFEKTYTDNCSISEVRGFYLGNNIGYLLWGCWSEADKAGMAKTEDGGASWHRIDTISNHAGTIYFSHFLNNDSIRIWGEFSDFSPSSTVFMLDTQDGFESFQIGGGAFPIDEEDLERYIKCCFSDHQRGIAFFWTKGFVLRWDLVYTYNHGVSWATYHHPSPFYQHRLYDVDGIDTVFYISGENGLVAKNQAFVLLDTDEQSISSVNVYPNPMIDRLFIKCEEESNVTIFSVTGEKLYDKKLVSEAIDVSHLEPGLYLIQITNHQGISYIQKLIKQ